MLPLVPGLDEGHQSAPIAPPADAPEAFLYRAIALRSACRGMSTWTFGIVALGDPNFVTELGLGRNPRLSTVDRAPVFMGAAGLCPAARHRSKLMPTDKPSVY